MRKFSKVSCFVLLSLIGFFGCKQEEDITSSSELLNQNDLTVQDGRLAFTSTSHYIETMREIAEMDQEELKNWSKQFNFKSLLSEQERAIGIGEENELLSDLESFYFPLQISTILNSQGEYMIGDTIVLYKEGYKHYIPNNDLKLLNQIKEDVTISQLKFEVVSAPLKVWDNNIGSEQSRVELGYNNDLDARHQHEFQQQLPVPGLRKYVHELWTFYDPQPWSSYSIAWLYLRIKMEWKGSGGWKEAGEPRDITWNLTGDYEFRKTNGYSIKSGNINLYNSLSGQTGHYYLPIAYADFVGYYCGTLPCNWEWDVEISGTITQVGSDDVISNKWTNTGNPLW